MNCLKLFCRLPVAVLTLWLLSHATVVNSLELGKYFKRSDQRAVEMLENGDAEAAANTFKDPQWRGVSRYKAGLFEQAMEDFNGAQDAQGHYNHGTAAARAGDYEQAVSSLEKALEMAPDDRNISHNLEIAKQLKELAENSQQQQQQDGDQENQQESSDTESESESQNEEQSQSEGEPESDGEEGESSNESPNDGQENSGESDASESEKSSEEEQQSSAEELRDMMQQEQQEQSEEQEESLPQVAAPAQDSVSEDDQATEQWLRRIPDDASQLLRNKIRLNHLIEYPEVDDMQEPW